ncbi:MULTISPECIES: type II toxin-antitoxin system RelE/ParE family toxin [unclassified Lacibacter]|uniref:type II toxin-antitoxin system RelE/ParE family toxin n=1 Tax=unclassified Lacibacter TaxID=2630913 RepID=UPI002B4AFDF3|nr:type II toxin-antitoxin system RelE/ParE family toxin [Lacibacter sp.]HLP38556.1 type II toxin-antitoxin system RelE/ParE family toxin [Lacibacter sp.]
MAYEVIWTLHAEEDYRQIIFYLKNEWSETVALHFINTTEERIERIAVFPLLGIASEKDNSIRSIVLTKHNKLYYQFLESKIYILSLFDTRQHPDKNKFE